MNRSLTKTKFYWTKVNFILHQEVNLFLLLIINFKKNEKVKKENRKE